MNKENTWMIDGRLWSVDGRLWSVDGLVWSVDGRLWSVDGCLWSVDSQGLGIAYTRTMYAHFLVLCMQQIYAVGR
jgi:hypothetical protein